MRRHSYARDPAGARWEEAGRRPVDSGFRHRNATRRLLPAGRPTNPLIHPVGRVKGGTRSGTPDKVGEFIGDCVSRAIMRVMIMAMTGGLAGAGGQIQC